MDCRKLEDVEKACIRSRFVMLTARLASLTTGPLQGHSLSQTNGFGMIWDCERESTHSHRQTYNFHTEWPLRPGIEPMTFTPPRRPSMKNKSIKKSKKQRNLFADTEILHYQAIIVYVARARPVLLSHR